MTYEEAVAALGAMQLRGWRLELDRMAAFAAALGVEKGGSAQFLHVAGTNGKGSTTAFIQSVLVSQGYRTGAYFSPYVYDIRERVQYGRDMISREDFVAFMEALLPVADHFVDTEFGGPTEFEAKTGLGFAYWQAKGCEAVALEVGLGGRLDATNIVDPAVSVITSIGHDHMKFLGPTLRDIAREKSGIVKPGRPLVTGDLPAEAMLSVVEASTANSARLWVYGRDFVLEGTTLHLPGQSVSGLVSPLRGARQGQNMAVAVAAVEAAGLLRDPGKVAEGVAQAHVPGRFEVHIEGGRTFVLDGAHNEEAGANLRDSLQSEFPDRRWLLVTCMLDGHTPEPFYRNLAPVVSRALVVPIDNDRCRDPEELAARLRRLEFDAKPSDLESLSEEFGDDLNILVTGSFYLLGAMKQAVGLP